MLRTQETPFDINLGSFLNFECPCCESRIRTRMPDDFWEGGGALCKCSSCARALVVTESAFYVRESDGTVREVPAAGGD